MSGINRRFDFEHDRRARRSAQTAEHKTLQFALHPDNAFGRTTRLPLASGQVIRVGYHANDLVASQTLYANAADADANSGAGQNPVSTSSYTLDLTGQRIATRTAQDTDPDTGATITRTKTLRYASGGDSPDWTDEGNGTITRNITGPTGDLTALATIDKTGAAADALAWQISDIHGDVAATLPAAETAPLQISRPDEYGAGTDDTPRYGWLGAKQRAGDTPGGLLLMGVRLYNPETGRFLSTDPVYGGNANTYTYPTDPINKYDLDGKWGWKRPKWLNWRNAARAAAVVGFGVCVFASAGACLAAGLVGAAVSARADAGRWGGRTYWRSFRRGAAWAVAGAGVGRGVSMAYQRFGGAVARSQRIGLGFRRNGRTGRFGYGFKAKKNWKYHPWHYGHQAKFGVVMGGYQCRRYGC